MNDDRDERICPVCGIDRVQPWLILCGVEECPDNQQKNITPRYFFNHTHERGARVDRVTW